MGVPSISVESILFVVESDVEGRKGFVNVGNDDDDDDDDSDVGEGTREKDIS